MMPFSPYSGYPYYRRPPGNSHNSNSQNLYNVKKEPTPKVSSNNVNNYNNNHDNNTNCNNSFFNNSVVQSCNSAYYEYEQFINIFGFKLYFDDLLILTLLFFLYKEEIKDESLYIALILLLLT